MPTTPTDVLKTRLFIVPFEYQNETEPLSEPDFTLHISARGSDMLARGCKIACPDLPSDFHFATELDKTHGKMHYDIIENKIGKFFPLFDSYQALCKIFGPNVHLAAVSFSTAQRFCLSEKLTGIVIGPGTSDIIVNHINDD